MTDVNPQQFHLEPVSAVVSDLTGVLHDLAEVEQKGCNETNFYRDAEAASGWLAANPNGVVLPVADTYELYREVYRRLQASLAQQTD